MRKRTIDRLELNGNVRPSADDPGCLLRPDYRHDSRTSSRSPREAHTSEGVFAECGPGGCAAALTPRSSAFGKARRSLRAIGRDAAVPHSDLVTTIYNRIAASDVGRIAALSDGIFAFAATVLVVDIHTPELLGVHSEADLLAALSSTAPLFLTWLMSLMTLGIFWVGQQTQLNRLARADRDLTWLHLVFLAIITLLPFTSAVLMVDPNP